MNEANNSLRPVIIIGGKAFDLSEIDFANIDNNPQLIAHIEAWLKKKEKAEARNEKRRLSRRQTIPSAGIARARFRTVRFLTFVKGTPPGDDPAMKSFYSYVDRTANLPQSSNPRVLANYLYLKLGRLQTRGYQFYMILYREQLYNQLPKDLKDHTAFLDALNAIVDFQNSDPHYKHS